MNMYLKDLAERLMRISRASMDIGSARKLRDLSQEIGEKAEAFDDGDFNRDGRSESARNRAH